MRIMPSNRGIVSSGETQGRSGGGGVTFADLKKKNRERCEEVFHFIDSWSPTDWACALAGEVGEACNLIKKMRRGDPKITRIDVGEELADVVIYADLLAQRLGLDLGY